jgi:hypothetical protein
MFTFKRKSSVAGIKCQALKLLDNTAFCDQLPLSQRCPTFSGKNATTVMVGWLIGRMCEHQNKWYTYTAKLLCNFYSTQNVQIWPQAT